MRVMLKIEGAQRARCDVAENSRALLACNYGDPALIAERNELRELGCRACEWHVVVLNRVICSNPEITNTKKVPFIGAKCKKFKLEEH
jgi:hypothetical protein